MLLWIDRELNFLLLHCLSTEMRTVVEGQHSTDLKDPSIYPMRAVVDAMRQRIWLSAGTEPVERLQNLVHEAERTSVGHEKTIYFFVV